MYKRRPLRIPIVFRARVSWQTIQFPSAARLRVPPSDL